MGKLIAVEGIDGCGKTTQIKLITEELVKKGLSVKTHAFYTRGTPIGDILDAYLHGKIPLSDPAVELLLEADRFEFQPLIQQWVKDYDVVLLDRYLTTGLAYGIAKGFNEKWRIDIQGKMIRAYDILLDIHPNAAMARMGGLHTSKYDRDLAYLTKVRECFSFLVPMKQRVDANRHESEVLKDVLAIISKVPLV